MKQPSLVAILVGAAAGYIVGQFIKEQTGACRTVECMLAGALATYISRQAATQLASDFGV
jgi:hypothetical protein